MKSLHISNSIKKLTELGAEDMVVYAEKTILIVVRSGILRRTLPIAILDKPATINQDIKAISLFETDICEFVYWYLKSIEQYILEEYSKSGTTVESINFDFLLDCFIPIPPISEQIKIIDQVNTLMCLIDNIDGSSDELHNIIKQTKAKVLDLAIRGKLVSQDPTDEPAAVLLERIKAEKKATVKPTKRGAKTTVTTSDNSHYENVPFEVPDSWVWCTIGEVCIFDNGYAFNSKDYSDQGVPIIRISNIKDGYIDIDNCVYTNCDNSIRDRFSIKKGDLLIAMSGATTGKMGVYNSDELLLLNQRVGNLKIKHHQILSQEYRNILMNGYKSAIISKAYGGAQPNISSNDILAMIIAIPPLKEQQRITAIVKKIFYTLDSIEESLR